MYERRNTPYLSAETARQLFTNAGFVDVKIVEKPIDIGDWRAKDPRKAAVARTARNAFGDAVPVLVENMKDIILDDEERKAFGEKALEEFKSGRYHVSLCTYENPFVIALMVGI